MRFRLRTLLIVLALGPVVIAGGYWFWPSQPNTDYRVRPSTGQRLTVAAQKASPDEN